MYENIYLCYPIHNISSWGSCIYLLRGSQTGESKNLRLPQKVRDMMYYLQDLKVRLITIERHFLKSMKSPGQQKLGMDCRITGVWFKNNYRRLSKRYVPKWSMLTIFFLLRWCLNLIYRLFTTITSIGLDILGYS